MRELIAAGENVYKKLLNVCVWTKDNGGMGSFYRSQHEMIFVYRNGESQHRNNIQLGKFGRSRTNVWRYPGSNTMSRTGNFAAQYQQNPQPKDGLILQRDWLQRYDEIAPLPDFTSKTISVDTANKSGELNDFSVFTVWGCLSGKRYLLDVIRLRLNYPELKRKAIELIQKHSPMAVVIEDKASGTQLIQDLKGDGFFGIKPYLPPPQTDKVMRFRNQTALFESGKVLLPMNARWLLEYEKELLSFPNSKFDDRVDSTAQALEYLSANRSADTWAALGRM